MITNDENTKQALSFWKTRKGILLQIIIVLIPSILLLKSGRLLLFGLLFSVCLSWVGLRLQRKNWSDVGLKRPSDFKKLFLTAAVSTIVLIPLTYLLRHLIVSVTHHEPNLEAFKDIQGNLLALLMGLVVVWIVAAFGEEMFFRG